MKLASAYLTVILIWSTTPLAMKWSTESLGFTEAAGLRTLIGALVCALLLLARRVSIPLHRTACLSYASAVLGVFGAMLCAFWAVQFIPSGLVSVMFGLAPLFSGLFAWPLLGERALGRLRLLGVLVAFGGLATVFRSDIGQLAGGLPGIVAAVSGTVLFSLSSVLVKRTSTGIDAIAHTTASLWLSLPLFAAAWALSDGQLPLEFSALSLGFVLYLAVIGSTLGFMLYFSILHRLTVAQVTLIPLATPVLALLLGAVVLDEPVRADTVIGAALILGGLALYQLNRGFKLPRRRRAAAAATVENASAAKGRA